MCVCLGRSKCSEVALRDVAFGFEGDGTMGFGFDDRCGVVWCGWILTFAWRC